MSAYDTIFEILIGHEGSFTNNQADSGNWTGGKVGVGELKGTKYGISAASYPHLDIAGLSLDAAKNIYKRDYYDKLFLDTADPGLALVAMDAAVNNGLGATTKWLQSALGVTADGVFGPQSQAALKACRGAAAEQALVEMHAARIHMMASLNTWSTFGKGWSKRLAQLPHQAARMGGNNGETG